MSTAKVAQPSTGSAASEVLSGNKSGSQQNKRRKAANNTKKAKAPAEQLTAVQSGSKGIKKAATDAAPHAELPDPPNKRPRTTRSNARNSEAHAVPVAASKKRAHPEPDSGTDADSDYQADAEEAAQADEAPDAGKQSQRSAGKQIKSVPAKAAAARRSRAKQKPADAKQQTAAQPGKPQKGKKAAAPRQAKKAALPAAADTEDGSKQPAKRQRRVGSAAGQTQQAQHSQHSSKQPASKDVAPVSAVAKETSALASKVLQQTLGVGLGVRPKPVSSLSDMIRPLNTAGKVSAACM